MKVTKPCTLTLADLCTRKVAAMIEKEKVFMGSFTKTFSALPIIAHPSFSGSPPSFSLFPFIMCGETCDDAKLVDRKVDAAFSYCCTICEGGREGGRSQMLLADISTKVLDRYGR